MSGGSQPSNTTSTQISGVPAWEKPYYLKGLEANSNLLQGPGPQYYPGQTVAPLNPVQEAGIGSVINTAGAGPLASQAAQAQNAATESGAYLYPQSNPYLDATFNHAADMTQNQLQSEFARSGRNVGAALPARSEELNNLANQIYGGNYQAERQRQVQSQAFAPSLDQAQYMPSQQLLNTGASLQEQTQNLINSNVDRWNYNQQLPYNMLSYYSGNLAQNGQPFRTSSQNIPTYSNPWMGAVGGAASGASIGSLASPGLGTAAGGLIGGLLGYLGGGG